MNNSNRILSSAAVATLVLAVGSIAQSPTPNTTSAPDAVANQAMAWKLNSLELAGSPKPKPDTKPKCPPPLHCVAE